LKGKQPRIYLSLITPIVSNNNNWCYEYYHQRSQEIPVPDNTQATFSFGKNWETFVETHFTSERIDISKKYILDFLGLDDLAGRYFLDVGCGSGLSSLAALRAGAARIVSFDVDADSVKTTARLREMQGNPEHWTVLQGSVLDKSFLATIEPADVLYSWGVLHHTGAMWEAIENTMALMKPDGVFYIALYTTTPKTSFWVQVKKKYNQALPFKKRCMEIWYVLRFILAHWRRWQNPFSRIFNYKRSRGMDFMTDVRDWLGGWPYEDATPNEVQSFFEKRGFRQLNVKTGEANTEYLFAKA